jgi:hypothetical protein
MNVSHGQEYVNYFRFVNKRNNVVRIKIGIV